MLGCHVNAMQNKKAVKTQSVLSLTMVETSNVKGLLFPSVLGSISTCLSFPLLMGPVIYQVCQKKVPNFENSKNQKKFTDLQDSNSSQGPEDRSIFVTFLTALRALEIWVNSILQEFHGCEMIEKGPKTLITDSSYRTIKKILFLMCERYLILREIKS